VPKKYILLAKIKFSKRRKKIKISKYSKGIFKMLQGQKMGNRLIILHLKGLPTFKEYKKKIS
jgi:bacterioferritin (cytochrome b1)